MTWLSMSCPPAGALARHLLALSAALWLEGHPVASTHSYPSCTALGAVAPRVTWLPWPRNHGRVGEAFPIEPLVGLEVLLMGRVLEVTLQVAEMGCLVLKLPHAGATYL